MQKNARYIIITRCEQIVRGKYDGDIAVGGDWLCLPGSVAERDIEASSESECICGLSIDGEVVKRDGGVDEIK